jgi:hypothetical protein
VEYNMDRKRGYFRGSKIGVKKGVKKGGVFNDTQCTEVQK